ncbi:hypothetical protein AOX55_00004783 (plasmid) [Sinorhizobium fredii CCBAU 25509]|nr:hypothetical protein AOX55_00004783 [Sinorhizobium fredii CCBAU 25509]
MNDRYAPRFRSFHPRRRLPISAGLPSLFLMSETGGTMPSNQAPRNVGIVCEDRPPGSMLLAWAGGAASRSLSGLPAWRREKIGHAHGFDQTPPAIRIISQICRNIANGAVLDMLPQLPKLW